MLHLELSVEQHEGDIIVVLATHPDDRAADCVDHDDDTEDDHGETRDTRLLTADNYTAECGDS